jgi:signal transduction histidine kinase
MARSEGRLQLTIHDDGKGFDPHLVDERERFGLRGMSERAEMMAGRLSIDSAPGKGTTISLVIPEAT